MTTTHTQAHLARMQYEPEDADNDEREDVPIYDTRPPPPPPPPIPDRTGQHWMLP